MTEVNCGQIFEVRPRSGNMDRAARHARAPTCAARGEPVGGKAWRWGIRLAWQERVMRRSSGFPPGPGFSRLAPAWA